MEGELTQFKNCRLVRNHALIKDDLWIRNGKIINPEPLFFDEKMKSIRSIDCNNAIIAPGFIDIQINGGYGVDFAHNTTDVAEGIHRVAKAIVRNGVTSFYPTLVTSAPETYRKVLPHIPENTEGGANVLGLHLEGPFINVLKKGAHEEECIRDFDKGVASLLETYGSLENVKIVTLAPEKDATGSITRYLTDKGITVALGHSQGNLSDGEKLVQNGAKLITHLFNAMLPFHHRDPGLVGLLTSDVITDDRPIYFSIISDGVHTHPAALRIAYRIHAKGLILVTDAISAMGLEEGAHHIGQLKLDVRQRRAYIAGTDTLCGSIDALDQCVRNFKSYTGCSTAYAIETVTLHPAQCLGITDTKGTLNFGGDADIVLLDDDLHVISTWINGQQIYSQ